MAGLDVPQAPGPVAVVGRAGIDIDGTVAEVRVTEDLRVTVDIDGEPITAAIAAADTPLVRSGDVFDSDAPLAVRIGAATLRAWGETLSLSGLDAEVDPGPAPAVTVRAARLDANQPGFAPPVDIEGHGTLDGDIIRFEGRTRAVDGVVAARFRDLHHLGSSDGAAEVVLQRINFIPGLLQPGDLSGAFPAVITDVRDGIDAKGSLSWGSGDLASDLVIGLHAIGFAAEGAVIDGVSGSVTLDRLWPPRTPPAALQGGGEGVSLMLEALKDFRYDVLRADIDGESGGEWTAALHLAGKNPNFLDGYRFELNFNFSGKLDAILRDGIKGFSLPERVGEGISGTRP